MLTENLLNMRHKWCGTDGRCIHQQFKKGERNDLLKLQL